MKSFLFPDNIEFSAYFQIALKSQLKKELDSKVIIDDRFSDVLSFGFVFFLIVQS